MKIYDAKLLFGDKIKYAGDGKNVRFACPCPAHSNREQINASFNFVTGEYICFGKCDTKFAKGKISELIVWLRDVCGIDAKISMIDSSEIEQFIEKQDDSWREQLSLPLAYNSEYLKKRGIEPETIDYFDLRHSTDDSMIVYPIRDFKDKIVGTNARYTKRKNQRYQVFGNKVPLANMDLISKNSNCSELFLTEGMFGVFNLYQLGYCAMAFLGSSGKLPLEIVTRYDKIYLCVDNDEAGYNKAISVFLKNPSVIVMKPYAYDEINEEIFDRFLNDKQYQAISVNGIKKLWSKE